MLVVSVLLFSSLVTLRCPTRGREGDRQSEKFTLGRRDEQRESELSISISSWLKKQRNREGKSKRNRRERGEEKELAPKHTLVSGC